MLKNALAAAAGSQTTLEELIALPYRPDSRLVRVPSPDPSGGRRRDGIDKEGEGMIVPPWAHGCSQPAYSAHKQHIELANVKFYSLIRFLSVSPNGGGLPGLRIIVPLVFATKQEVAVD